MYFTVAGMVKLSKAEQPQKQLCSIVSTGAVIVTLERLVFSSKASTPIVVMLPPMVTSVRALLLSEK